MSDNRCYHCGLDVPTGVLLSVTITNMPRAMCCYGCQAVAQSIVDGGLSDYYQSRDALPESPREARPAVLHQLDLYDHQEFQKSFVKNLGDAEREASLLLEGITCAACIWLNEKHLAKQAGVVAVSINYSTRRARVRWDDSRIKLSQILQAISSIGYRAYPYDAEKSEEISQRERRSALWRLWVAGFGMMQVMMYAFPVYVADGEMPPDIESLMRWASFLLTLPVVFYSAAPFFQRAWRDLRFLRVGMDVPVALGIGTAFLASCYATFTASGAVYFDSVTMFVFLLLGGRFLEMTARQKAIRVTEALTKLLPAFAAKLSHFPISREATECLVVDLCVGDHLLVKAGDTIPADGVVVEGQSFSNESLLTGESRPVPKALHDEVTGGAINTDSPLIIRVTALGADTRLSAIIALMERAATEKPHIVLLADRVAAVFVAALLFVATGVALFWFLHDPDRALWITVSVLVVTCPCALSLATPIALTVAAGAFAKQGLLITRGHALETLAGANHYVFDKTGTLTTGNMQLLDCLTLSHMETSRCLSVAAALEEGSEHPVAEAILRAFELSGDPHPLPLCSETQGIPGQGITGDIEGRRYQLGRPDLIWQSLNQKASKAAAAWLESGDTIVLLADEQEALALFRLGDTLRADAKEVIDALHAAGKKVSLLTGDAPAVALRIGALLGIAALNIHAGARPADKREVVKNLQLAGDTVAMVGDGVNDAPVMAQAAVSIAMGGGTELARTQSDFVLLSDNLKPLAFGLRHAEKSLKIIRQNLIWSFAYNFVALPLAMTGYVTPWMAGVGMSASSLLVVLNALRLQKNTK